MLRFIVTKLPKNPIVRLAKFIKTTTFAYRSADSRARFPREAASAV